MIGAILLAVAVSTAPAMAAEDSTSSHSTIEIAKEPWTFAGIFGTFDNEPVKGILFVGYSLVVAFGIITFRLIRFYRFESWLHLNLQILFSVPPVLLLLPCF